MRFGLRLRGLQRPAMCLAIALATTAPARAMDAPSSTQVFDRAYFERYEAVNAEDMLLRVPGTSSILSELGRDQQDRGFGSGGDQVLLNGKRFAGKGQILSTLRRIQSDKVQQIELIRGNTGDTNVQSEGLIINVVLIEGASTGSGSWQANARFNDEGYVNGDGLVSYSNSWGALDYIIGIERQVGTPPSTRQDPINHTRTETYFFPNGAVQEIRVQKFDNSKQEDWTATTNLAYNFASGARFRLNTLLQFRETDQNDDTAFTRFDIDGNPTLTAFDRRRNHTGWEKGWEIGGDYEGQLLGGNLNVLFINTRERDPGSEFRYFDFGTSIVERSRNIIVETEMESIIRGSITWPIFTGQTLEVGAEAARNSLDQDLRPFFDLDDDGVLEEVAIPTANAKVKELRGEAFAMHNWQITSDLSLNTSLVVEMSRITNNFPFSPSHTYVYPKPRADLRYDITPEDQIRFKVERLVSQLNFENFVPSFDIEDSEIDAGNPAIRPEREWEFEVGYQRQLPNNQGLIEGRVFYKAIQDHIDKFILRTEPDGTRVSAPGNIGSGRHYGFEVVASVRLTALGLPDFVIDARYLRRKSRTTDPFTGLHRAIVLSDAGGEHWQYTTDIGFRHDVTAWGFSYGMTYDNRNGILHYSDIRVQEFQGQSRRIQAFAEKKLSGGLTMRVEGYGLWPNRSRDYRERVVYADDVIQGTVQRQEVFVDRMDRIVLVSLRGTF